MPIKEENVQENIHENVHEDKKPDSWSDSRKSGAKSNPLMLAPPSSQNSESPKRIPEKAEPKPDPSADREMLSYRMAQHMGRRIPLTGELDQPDDSFVEKAMKALGSLPVIGFSEYLRNLPREYQTGGRAGPTRSWGWFVSTARNYAVQQGSQEPTVDRCRHGYEYSLGLCCNRSEVNDAMTGAFDTTDDLRQSTGLNGAADA